jgi:hypothetical protein
VRFVIFARIGTRRRASVVPAKAGTQLWLCEHS